MNLWFNILRDELANIRDGDMTGLSDTMVRRRRTYESMVNFLGLNAESFRSIGSSDKRISNNELAEVRKLPSHKSASMNY